MARGVTQTTQWIVVLVTIYPWVMSRFEPGSLVRGGAATWRPRPASIPAIPGVYRFRDRESRVIYVGKARNLRSRLASYFADPATLPARTAAMVDAARSVDWVTVPTDLDALQLEYSWIKEFEPRYNVRFRDDKSYPYLAVTMLEEFPRVFVTRGERKRGIRYFGPYPQGWSVRETLERLMLRTFPVRTCSAGVFRRHQALGRPCLLGDIGKCAAPCVGRVSADEHRAIASDLCAFLGGRGDAFVRNLELEMSQAAERQDYERAAVLRDEATALRKALEQSAVVMPAGTNADMLSIAADELEAAVQVFHVRDGRVRGQQGSVVERPVQISDRELIEQVLSHVYGGADADAIPREIWVEHEPEGGPTVADWLGTRRGGKVSIKVPRRGRKRELMATVRANAEQDLARHKLRRGADLASRSRALAELRETLGLREAPLRIECIDISSHAGQDPVASIVVFDDALPAKKEYRRYVIRAETDDAAAIREAVERRYADRDGRARYAPGLLVVDGGRPQVEAAAAGLQAVGGDAIPVRGLAKRLEEVWSPGEPRPLILSRRSEALYLLQRVRDEAHRVAIAHHRSRSGRRATASEIDAIPGLGPTRKRALLRHFGSVRAIRAASHAELAQVEGIGPALAAAISLALATREPGPAVNVTTGEILDHA